jgi:murein DD-endopeptidase MepM/ murein hydrolase activator NlpD
MFFIFFVLTLYSNTSFGKNKTPNPDSVYVKKIDALFDKSVLNRHEIEQVYKEVHYHELVKFYDNKSSFTLFWPIPVQWVPDSMLLDLKLNFSDYCNPFQGIITSGYGWRGGRMHKGIDINLRKGDLIKAVADGTVRFAGKCGGWGNVVVIDHGQGIETLYAHLSKILVKPGQMVLSEQLIGKGGNTGRSRGPHLHFELRLFGHAVNPLSLIEYRNSSLYHHEVRLVKTKEMLYLFPSKAKIYKTVKGDSWKKIAKMQNKSVKELYELNGLIKKTSLRPGTYIRLE